MLAGQIQAHRRIALVETDEPRLRDDEPDRIVFEPSTACLCGSDRPYFEEPRDAYPLTLGLSLHEMVGRVRATNGRRFREGDLVLAVPVAQVGLFERFLVDERRAIPVPEGLDEAHAVLAQPLGTAIYALKKVPRILDADVAIVGQGPMGQIFARLLRQLGARHVIAIDRLPERLARSRAMGASHVVDASREDPVESVREITGGKLPELVIEAVGHRDQAMNLAIRLLPREGRLLYFGVPPERIDGIDWLALFKKNVTVITSVDPDFERDFPLAMRMIAEGRIDLRPLVTHVFPLAQIQSAFETFSERREGALKVLVEFPAKQTRAPRDSRDVLSNA